MAHLALHAARTASKRLKKLHRKALLLNHQGFPGQSER